MQQLRGAGPDGLELDGNLEEQTITPSHRMSGQGRGGKESRSAGRVTP